MTVQSIIVNKPTWARSLSLHSQEAALSTIKIFPFFFIFYQPSSTNTTHTPTCAHTYSFLGIGRANYEHNAPLFPKYFNDNSLKIKTFSRKINAKTTTTKTGFSLFLIELLLLSLFFLILWGACACMCELITQYKKWEILQWQSTKIFILSLLSSSFYSSTLLNQYITSPPPVPF